MAKRCIVPPLTLFHKHRCEFCKTVSTCPGVACKKIIYRTCFVCASPEKVKFRAEQKRQEILDERQAGEQLYIFESRVGVAGLPPPAWFQEYAFSYKSASATYPMLTFKMPVMPISWDAADNAYQVMEVQAQKAAQKVAQQAAEQAVIEKMNMTPTPPFIMHPQAYKELQSLGLAYSIWKQAAILPEFDSDEGI